MLVYYDRNRRLYILPDVSKARGFGVVVYYLKGNLAITTIPLRNIVELILFLLKTLIPTK